MDLDMRCLYGIPRRGTAAIPTRSVAHRMASALADEPEASPVKRNVIPVDNGARRPHSKAKRIGFRHPDFVMLASERRDGAGFVEPHERVELLRQRRFRVARLQLGLRPVD